jgi:hypothetical protein
MRLSLRAHKIIASPTNTAPLIVPPGRDRRPVLRAAAEFTDWPALNYCKYCNIVAT